MSTYFRPNTTITLDDIAEVNNSINKLNGKMSEDTRNLKKNTYSDNFIHIILKKDNPSLFYRNGSYLHFDMNKKGHIIDVRRYGSNDDSEILLPIEDHLGMLFVSEHEDEYSELADDETNVVNIKFGGGV